MHTSTTAARLWEIGRRHRVAVAVLQGTTAAGRLLDYTEQPTHDPSSLITLLAMASFVCLFGIWSYTESQGTRDLGGFPRRLFTLPVSSLHLVGLPMLGGVISVEILYALWFTPLSRDSVLSPLFVAVLLGSFVVLFQAAFWTLERLGSVRLIVVGVLAVAVYLVGLLPSWPPTPPAPWRTEVAVGSTLAALAGVAFLVAWRHVRRLRSGGGRRRAFGFEPLVATLAGWWPERRTPFASGAGAQVWFEWQSAGRVLPVLVGSVIVGVIAPTSWWGRDDGGATLRLLLATLATPIVLAIPVGLAFSRPVFWSDDLSMPAFVAVRPLTDEAIVTAKLRVAALSAAASWAIVIVFLGLWLGGWANLDAVGQLALQWWAFHEHSVASVPIMVVVTLAAGIVLTFRSLVSRLWTGLSGDRPQFLASVLSGLGLVVAYLLLAADRFPGWVLQDPGRMTGVAWCLAVAVTAKCGLAAGSWRCVCTRHLWTYAAAWGGLTICLATLAWLLWDVLRIYLAVDACHLQSVMLSCALLAVPIGRIGLAPVRLFRNRHR